MYVILLLILLFSGADKPVKKQNPTHPKENRTQDKLSSPTPTATPSPAIQEPNPPQNGNDSNTPSNDRTYKVQVKETPPDYWMRAYVIVNGILAISALGTLLFVRHQRDVMKDQLQAMHAQLTEMQMMRAQTAGDFGEANKIHREGLQAVQRAYISFIATVEQSKGVDEKTGDRGKEWWFWIPVENSGVTPALNLTLHTNWVCQSTPLEDNFSFPDYANKHIPFIVPGKTRISTPALKIEEQWIKRVYEGSHYLYFYGWAGYRDVFEGTADHVTTFCFEIIIHQIAGNEMRITAKFHHEHNTQI